jgi:hypothetical protein
METGRLSQGQMIAAAGGVLLFIFLFLPWFEDVSGWEGQSSTDIYMLITALVAVGAALTDGGGLRIPGVTMNGATALLGGVATILLLWLIIFDFPEGAGRGIGIILSVFATAAIAYGGYTAALDEPVDAGPDRY